jgi:hypothetical protein
MDHVSGVLVALLSHVMGVHFHYSLNFSLLQYRGADKSLARPGRKQATATEDFDVHISYL